MLHDLMEKWIAKSADALAMIGAVSIFLLMLATVVGVFMRKVLSAPMVGIDEYSQILLILVIFFFLAYSGWTGGQIAVDVINAFLKERASRMLSVVVNLAGAALVGVVAWRLVEAGIGANMLGVTFNLTEIPHAPFYHVAGFGFGVYAVVLAVMAWRSLSGLSEYPKK